MQIQIAKKRVKDWLKSIMERNIKKRNIKKIVFCLNEK